LAQAVTRPSEKPAFSLSKLVRGSSARVLNLCLMASAGFVVMPLIVKALGPEQYGIWALAWAFTSYYSMLDLGLSAAVFTHMAHALGRNDETDAQRIFSSSLSIFGSIGGILTLVTLLLAAFVFRYYTHGPLFAGVLLIVGLHTAIGFPMRVPYGCLNAGTHFDSTAWLFILSTVLRTAGTLLALHMHGGVISLALANLLGALPSHVLALLEVKRKYPFLAIWKIPRREKATSRKLINYGIPVLIGDFADRIRLQTDTVTVSWFVGIAAVAHYNIATSLVSYYVDGILAIIGVLTPVFSIQSSRNDQDGLRQSFFTGTRVAICAGGFAAFGIVAWGHAFIERWMGTSYLDAYPILVVLAIALLFDVCQSTSVNALAATMNQKYYAALNISEAIANLTLSILLARRYGMLGIAYGTLIPSFIVRILIQPLVIQKRLRIKVRDYLGASLPTIARVLLFLAVPLLISRALLQPNYPSLLLVGAISLSAFALPIWYFEFQMIGAQKLREKVHSMWLAWRTG
jgi:O-antigen/teichoic acid export membrane protein